MRSRRGLQLSQLGSRRVRAAQRQALQDRGIVRRHVGRAARCRGGNAEEQGRAEKFDVYKQKVIMFLKGFYVF
jgi:hypothetical protein